MRHLVIGLIFSIGVATLVACGKSGAEKGDLSGTSTEELIRALEDTQGSSNLFPDLVAELASRGSAASEAGPALARALAYDRRDSTIASRALIAMGPAAVSAIPELLRNLDSQREEVRRYSIFVLGIIGRPSGCAVPRLASLLWDPEPGVRSAAAAAIQAITAEPLVEPTQELDPSLPGSVYMDQPEGSISGRARSWWLHTGGHIDWSSSNCKDGQ